MAEEGKPTDTATTAAAGDSAPDAAAPAAETTATKTPEPATRVEEDAGASGKDAADGDAADKDEAAPATGADEKAEPTTAPEPAEESKTTESAEQEGAGDGEAAGTNGEAASAKKSGGKRKSSGVPEHRVKKLNKKKSAGRILNINAKPGEYYLARLKSYPAWPSIICDEEILPEAMLSNRPVTTKQPDGTYKPGYEDGGKRAPERTFPIMFFYTNEFAWVPNYQLSPLDPEECKNVSEKNKKKDLIGAYEVASEGHDLQYFKTMLAEHALAVQEDEEARQAKAAEKAAKQEKKKRKSMDVAGEPDDEEAGDTGTKRKSAKKRKKDVESEGESEKPVKTPKTATKLKLTTPKTPATGETKKKAAASTKATKSATKSKGASAKKKSAKAAASDEEEEAAAESPKPEPLNPQEARQKREQEVFYLRHKLQKGLLTRDQAPKAEEMEAMSNYIAKLDSYSDLEVSIIRKTKINKVLKAIIKLDTIPKDEEYNFRGRAIDVLKKWRHLFEAETPAQASKGKKEEKEKGEKEVGEKPTANGVNDVNGKAAEGEAETKEAAADEDTPMPDADAEPKSEPAKAEDAHESKDEKKEEKDTEAAEPKSPAPAPEAGKEEIANPA